MSNCTILVADDEAETRRQICYWLKNAGYQTIEAENGVEVMDLLIYKSVDMCLIDIMMPIMDGLTALRKLRRITSIPVIITSEQNSSSEKVQSLNLGADNYLVKPFNPMEVVAQVNACLRRKKYFQGKSKNHHNCLRDGDLELDLSAYTLWKNEKVIPLTPLEYRLMVLFMENPGQTFTTQQIYETCWYSINHVATDQDLNNVMVRISQLRNKLDSDNKRYIRTVRRCGYVWKISQNKL